MRSFNQIILVCCTLLSINLSYGQNIDFAKIEDWLNKNSESNIEKTLDTLGFLEQNLEQFDLKEKFEILERNAKFALFELKDFKKCMGYMETLRSIVYAQKDHKYQIKFHNSLGELYYSKGLNVNKSYEEFTKAINILEKNKSEYLADIIYSNYAISLVSEGKFDDALKLNLKALRISEKKKDYSQQSITTNNIGVVYIYLQNKDSAEYYFLKSLDLAKKTKEKDDEILRSIFLGLFNNDNNNPKDALNYFNFALENIEEIKSYNSKIQLCRGLSRSYMLLENYKDAYFYKSQELLYLDSAEKNSLQKESFVYEYDLKIKSLADKNKIEVIKNQKFKLQIVILILVVGLLFISLFFIVLRSRKNKQLVQYRIEKEAVEKEKLVLEKELTERENASKAMFLLEKDNLINSISLRLQDIVDQLNEKYQPLVQSLIHELKFSVNNKRWEEFELRFNKVNPNFFEKLEKEFPNLSPNEKKLCAFLSMNMTSKDISSITGQTSHSINIARGRLRKKLNINNSNIDVITFLSKYN